MVLNSRLFPIRVDWTSVVPIENPQTSLFFSFISIFFYIDGIFLIIKKVLIFNVSLEEGHFDIYSKFISKLLKSLLSVFGLSKFQGFQVCSISLSYISLL